MRFGGLLAAAATLGFGACAANEPAASSPTTTQVATTSTEPVPPPTTSGRIPIIRQLDDFQYYGACGNETVRVGSTTFYPVPPRQRREIDEPRYPVYEEDNATPSGLTRVVPPGPGDDVGTMIVYADGMARFASDSGRVIWLTDEEQTYNSVC
jgi:hypothetical protein